MPRKIKTKRTSGAGLHKDGVYQLVIVKSIESVSKSNNDMVELRLKALRNGQPFGPEIRDYLVFEDSSLWKLDAIHDALELDEEQVIDYRYYQGKKVFASLISQPFGGRVNNKVQTYLSPEAARILLEQQNQSSSIEEDFDLDDDDDVDLDDSEEDNEEDEIVQPVASRTATRGRKRRTEPEILSDDDDDDDDDMPL